jgi:hypothetical protein
MAAYAVTGRKMNSAGATDSAVAVRAARLSTLRLVGPASKLLDKVLTRRRLTDTSSSRGSDLHRLDHPVDDRHD